MLWQLTMASLYQEMEGNQFFTNELSADEFEERLELLKNCNRSGKYFKQKGFHGVATPRTEEFQMKSNTLELPLLIPGKKTRIASRPTSDQLLRDDDKVHNFRNSRGRCKTSPPLLSSNDLPKKYIRRVKPCPPGSIVRRKTNGELESKRDFICLGTNLNDMLRARSGVITNARDKKPNKTLNETKSNEKVAVSESDFNAELSTLPEIPAGPVFRPWSKDRKERPRETQNEDESYDPNVHYDWKKKRCFDLKAMLKNLTEIQQNRNFYQGSFLPMLKSYNNVAEITMDTSASYATRLRAASSMSSKGGGYRRRILPTVKDEVQMKKMMRQHMSSFYDLGGSVNHSERLLLDACSTKYSPLKLKYLPAFPPGGLSICPLAVPHSRPPFIPISKLDLQKIYNILDDFPWYSWEPTVDTEKRFESATIGPESTDDKSVRSASSGQIQLDSESCTECADTYRQSFTYDSFKNELKIYLPGAACSKRPSSW